MIAQTLTRVFRPLCLSVAFAGAALLTACGDDTPGGSPGNGTSSESVGTDMDSVAASAARLEAGRRMRGDTVPMDYSTLQAMLPAAPAGYEADGVASGSSSKAGGFGVSEVRQRYLGIPEPNVIRPRIEVALADLGNSQIGVSIVAERMLAGAPAPDAEQRVRTRRLSIPYTWLSEEYFPQSHTAKVTAITRFRYLITVTAQLQPTDPTPMLAEMVAQVAASFNGM